jgi:hypothetical protein
MRKAVLFDAPPKMLSQAIAYVQDYWCQGLLWQIDLNRDAAAKAKSLAITEPTRKLKRTLAALPQLVSKAQPGKWTQFRYIPEQGSPDIFDNLSSYRPNPHAIKRTPWRQESYWLRPLTPEEIEERRRPWDTEDDSPKFYLVHDPRHRARPPSKPDSYVRDREQVLDTLKYAYEEGVESVEYAVGWFNDLNASLDRLEALARKYTPRPARKPEGDFDLTIDMDLSGWKYIDHPKAAETRLPRSITLRFSYGSSHKYLGLWYGPPIWRLEILSRDYHLSGVAAMQAFLDDVARTTRHEMQHFGQDALSRALDLQEDGGLPSRSVRTPGIEPGGRPRGNRPLPMEEGDPHGRIKHELRDVEFHTRLADEVDRFLDKLRDPEETGYSTRVPVEHWADFIKHFTGAKTIKAPRDQSNYSIGDWEQSHWFTYIKQHDKPRWKEAVRKLVAELDQRGIMRQIKRVKRWVPVVESNHPAWGVSVMGYWRELMQKLSPGTQSYRADPEEKAQAQRKHWPTIRDEYESFTDSLTPDQLVRHKQLVNENGDKWYFINPKLQRWDGTEDLGGSKPPYADHPDLPKMHRYGHDRARSASVDRVASQWLKT